MTNENKLEWLKNTQMNYFYARHGIELLEIVQHGFPLSEQIEARLDTLFAEVNQLKVESLIKRKYD